MTLPFDPQSLPVAGVDDHLPAVAPDRLDVEAIRERFARTPVWSPETTSEPRRSERGSAAASVLIGVVPHPEPTVLLTMRTDHLTDHPGQISFPGGRVEPHDADAAATALREAFEEIGLARTAVDVLGTLPTYTTGTGFVVTPVVGAVRPGQVLRADPHEVAEIFEVPLQFLMDPAHHRRHDVTFGGVQRSFLSMPWTGIGADGQSREYFIWGATAAMLRNLYRFLSA
jgi:8-oxo-dGTP pyrophosphatase MutT (NUDIX family)